ncbi:hypothetical protein NM688_g5995 [Phlebia brevispora]|uniref:Uncharacterized protein n=1 Tax=Phlebia brevispora TaxID=194682 RepID=A0ACC1SLT0_9APHY|nr:hypothetical protein NM688_g5995 [Phlebia brevispora]
MYAPVSTVGRRFLSVFVILLLVDVVVVALAAKVNIYQEFFFMADLFPLGLSIATLIVLFFSITTDIVFYNAFASRPAFKIGLCFVLSTFWLAFNIFSTSRWGNIPMPCSSVPSDLPDERAWCEDVQALKSFVWIFFVGGACYCFIPTHKQDLKFTLVFLTGAFTVRYAVAEHQHGNRSIWNSSLIRFDPYALDFDTTVSYRPGTATDYFASIPGNAISGQAVDPKW